MDSYELDFFQFCLKMKFWSTFEILLKNRNFEQMSMKKHIFDEKSNFGKKIPDGIPGNSTGVFFFQNLIFHQKYIFSFKISTFFSTFRYFNKIWNIDQNMTTIVIFKPCLIILR